MSKEGKVELISMGHIYALESIGEAMLKRSNIAHNSQKVEIIQVPLTERQTYKQNVVWSYNGTSITTKRNELLVTCYRDGRAR